jgi:hypothetical protein
VPIRPRRIQRFGGDDPPDRVGRRGAQTAVELGVERLELVPYVLFGAAGDLAPDTLPVRPEAERDGTDAPILRRIEVDRVLAAAATARLMRALIWWSGAGSNRRPSALQVNHAKRYADLRKR